MRTRVRVDVNPYLDKKRQVSLAESFALTQDEVNVMTGQVDYQFRKHETEIFKSEGSAGGPRFAPLTAEYAKWKRRHFPGRRILSLTGKLRKSLTQTKNTNQDHVAYGVAQPRPAITVGTSNRLAAYHGTGQFHNSRLPVRDSIQHKPTDEQRYLDILAEYFVKQKIPRIQRVLRRWKATRVT